MAVDRIRSTWTLFLVASSLSTTLVIAEDQRGIVHVYGSSRIKVNLECASKFINVNLTIDSSTPFFDWIVVGKTNRPECRQQGNGDLQYLIEIPLLNDPCGTKMVEPSGTFENLISIKKMPLLILEGDETVSVQCVYGPPEVITPIIPTLPLSDNVQPSFLTSTQPVDDQPSDDSSITNTTKTAGILPAHIYLIIFMALFLTLLCLCCGCMYFFFKRRKLRVERRKKLLLAVPPNSEMSKLALRHLFWSGKHGQNSEMVSNDALLSQDYILSTTSTRGHLSVSTDYPSTTPPSTGASSNGSRDGGQGGSPAGHGSLDTNGSPENGQLFLHKDRRMLMEPMVGRTATGVMIAANVVSNSLRCIPEERNEYMTSDAYTTRSQGSIQTMMMNTRRPVYAAVEKRAKLGQNDSPNGSSDDSPPANRPSGSSTTTQTGPASEFYSSVPTGPGRANDDEDAASISTLEGRRYSPTQEHIREATIVRADIHHIPSPPISMAPSPPTNQLSSMHSFSPSLPAVPQFVNSHFHGTSRPPTRSSPINGGIDWGIFIRAIENDRSQILTDQDIDRWRRMINEDEELRRLVLDSGTAEDFQSISRLPKYRSEFSEGKWDIIVHNLAQAAFMRRLTNIIDNQHGQQTKQPYQMGKHGDQSIMPMISDQSIVAMIGDQSIVAMVGDHSRNNDDQSMTGDQMRRPADQSRNPADRSIKHDDHWANDSNQWMRRGDQSIMVTPLDPSQLNSSYNMGETLRNLQNGRQKRIFTRESYNNLLRNGASAGSSEPDFTDSQTRHETSLFVVSKDGQVASAHRPSSSANTTMTSQPFRDRSNSEVFECPPTLTVYMGDLESQRNLYAESFMNGENAYSVASASTGDKLYPYESTGSRTEDEHQYQVGNLMANANSMVGSTGDHPVYAPPSSSTLYGPDIRH